MNTKRDGEREGTGGAHTPERSRSRVAGGSVFTAARRSVVASAALAAVEASVSDATDAAAGAPDSMYCRASMPPHPCPNRCTRCDPPSPSESRTASTCTPRNPSFSADWGQQQRGRKVQSIRGRT